MTSPGIGVLHGVRVLLLAVVLVSLSLTAHSLAGGARPGIALLVALTALTAVAVRPMGRREVTLPKLIGFLGGGQVALHFLFEQSASLSVAPVASTHHHVEVTAGPLMVVAHVVATLVVAVLARYGEALLWRLWAWLTARVVVRSAPAIAGGQDEGPRVTLCAVPIGRVPGTLGGRAPPAAF